MKERPTLDYINRISYGDKAFTKKILEIVKRELPNEINTYRLHLKDGDYVKTAQDVHKLKHKITILGLEESLLIATEYERNLKEGILHRRSDFEEILSSMLLFMDREIIE